MDFKWITPGEFQKGQYITISGFLPQKEAIIVNGDVLEVTRQEKNPIIKGIPLKILSVQLPMLMVENIAKVPSIPPVVFYDTRLVEFIEVDEDYALIYKEHVAKQLAEAEAARQRASQPQVRTITQEQLLPMLLAQMGQPQEEPEVPQEPKDEQEYFPFHDESKDDEDGDEPPQGGGDEPPKDDGPPPLVTA